MPVAEHTAADHRKERRAKERSLARAAILEAARRVAARDGAANLSLRAAAAEAGFAPAALYGYFANKSELLIALAAEDLARLARAMREVEAQGGASRLSAVADAVLSWLEDSETIAAAPTALSGHAGAGASEAERLFNGRLIAVLRALSEAAGHPSDSREAQTDVVLIAAALAGLAVFARSGRLEALGFSATDMIAALGRRFSPAR